MPGLEPRRIKTTDIAHLSAADGNPFTRPDLNIVGVAVANMRASCSPFASLRNYVTILSCAPPFAALSAGMFSLEV